eukprot:2855010-Rhodomonas_salina.1
MACPVVSYAIPMNSPVQTCATFRCASFDNTGSILCRPYEMVPPVLCISYEKSGTDPACVCTRRDRASEPGQGQEGKLLRDARRAYAISGTGIGDPTRCPVLVCSYAMSGTGAGAARNSRSVLF